MEWARGHYPACVDAYCGRCGRSLGRYNFFHTLVRGEEVVVPALIGSNGRERPRWRYGARIPDPLPHRPSNWRRGRLMLDSYPPGSGSLYVRWTCGCGADGYMGATKLARLEVEVRCGGARLEAAGHQCEAVLLDGRRCPRPATDT
jgi:hypothetical protein